MSSRIDHEVGLGTDFYIKSSTNTNILQGFGTIFGILEQSEWAIWTWPTLSITPVKSSKFGHVILITFVNGCEILAKCSVGLQTLCKS